LPPGVPLRIVGHRDARRRRSQRREGGGEGGQEGGGRTLDDGDAVAVGEPPDVRDGERHPPRLHPHGGDTPPPEWGDHGKEKDLLPP